MYVFSEIVFSDDFNGNKLDFSKWWIYKNEPPDPADWEYSVNDGWLNVWKVWGSIPGETAWNKVGIRTWDHLVPDDMTDFDVRAKVKWEQGEIQALTLGVNRTLPLYLSYFKNEGEEPYIQAAFFNWSTIDAVAKIPAPDSGTHEFRITRQGKILSAFLIMNYSCKLMKYIKQDMKMKFTALCSISEVHMVTETRNSPPCM